MLVHIGFSKVNRALNLTKVSNLSIDVIKNLKKILTFEKSAILENLL